MAVHGVTTQEEWEAQQPQPDFKDLPDAWDSWSCAVHEGPATDQQSALD